mgnify:CR=1 FL=1
MAIDHQVQQEEEGGMTSRIWTDDRLEILARRYPNENTADLATDMCLTKEQLHRQANKMGLKKTPEFYAQHGQRLDGAIGQATRFKKGNKAWNAGKSFHSGGRSVEHQFKPGMLPHNHKPIGHIRITADGYQEQKMTDTGVTRHDYVAVHRLAWTAAHGPIPDGHVVVFKDGNKMNTDLGNLELISRKELARRNTIHRLPPELKETIYLLTSVQRRIRKNEKQG